MKTDQRTWGSRTSSRREQLGLTQTQLADACRAVDPAVSITQQTISKIENNSIRPRDRIRDVVARAMGTTAGELFPPDEYRFSGAKAAS